MWAGSGEGAVWRIDPITGRTTATVPAGKVTLGSRRCGLAVGHELLRRNGVRVDPMTNSVVATFEVGYQPKWLAVDDDHAWVGVSGTKWEELGCEDPVGRETRRWARVDSCAMTAPKRFPDRDLIADVRAEAEPLEDGADAGTTRRVAGRAMARRGMGKLVFLDVVDLSGRIQVICDVAATGDVDIHLGDVVGVVGRPAKSRRGEPSVSQASRCCRATRSRCRTRSTG